MSTSTAAVPQLDAFVVGTHDFVRHLGQMVDQAIARAEAGDRCAARQCLHQAEAEMFAAIAALPAPSVDDGSITESLFCVLSSWVPGLDRLAHLADELGTAV